MPALVFLGNGGLAREIALIADLVDPKHDRWDSHSLIGPEAEEAALAAETDVVVAVGHANIRLALWEKYGARAELNWPTLIHPRADLGPHIQLGNGVGIASGVVMTTDIVIGAATYINLSVTIGHDSRIGQGCVVNPSASISGGVTIGDGCLVGTHAVILEGRTVGSGSIVGAGAIVTRDVPDHTVVVGSPARPIRSTSS